ncbi:MAG: Na/Pi cotransporter family protein [Treponema sp.]|jgi:phosphate:Na+ symporter|nr:Na/Pi cotransporter family protein [Treponema sp.]
MGVFGVLFKMLGGLCLFLFGMKIMSDGIQQSAGDRLRNTLGFMTGNRFAGVLTGFVVTGIIQSSSAVTVMVVSFVNAGLLTLTQSIGVIMGANIGTTVTAWIVSLVGFKLSITNLALPAIGIGFIFSIVKWKYKSLGELLLGFGLLFLGLNYLTQEMTSISKIIDFNAIGAFRDMGFSSVLIGAGAGLFMTMLIHSSSAATAIVITMAFSNIVTYEMAASMVLGANIGTTIDAALAGIGARTAAKRAALVHVLFNIIGTLWALPLIKPLLTMVAFLTPGNPVAGDPSVTTHLAMLHTVFNSINTILFLPFVKQFAVLVSLIIKDRKGEVIKTERYQLVYKSGTMRDTPELNILRAEKEIQDMAGIASNMYGKFSTALNSMQEGPLTEDAVNILIKDLLESENLADEMRVVLTAFLMECARQRLNQHSRRRVSRLLVMISDLEDMTDECYALSLILERSVKKNQIFKSKEVTALIPYIALVAEFLTFIRELQLGNVLSERQTAWAQDLENRIDESRNKLRKFARKRIEAGKDVKTELLFIDLVRRIEKLGDYCYSIAAALAK